MSLSAGLTKQHCLDIPPHTVFNASFHKTMLSNKWIISNAKQVLLNQPHIWRSSEFKLHTIDCCFLTLQWEKDTPERIQPAKLVVCLATGKLTHYSVVSDCFISITDCVLHRIITVKDQYVRYGTFNNSLVDLIKGIFYISENELIDSIFGTGSTLTIQMQAAITNTSASSMLPLQPTVKSEHDLGQKMYQMYKDSSLTDITIKTDNQTFHAHKVVIASQSDVFKRMLESNMKEREQGLIEISDITSEVMEELLTYFYTGSVPHLKEFAKDLLLMADKYDIPHLSSLCQDELKMSLSIDNCVSFLLLAESVHLTSESILTDTCIKFIKQHSTAVKQTSSWTKLFKELPQELASKLTI